MTGFPGSIFDGEGLSLDPTVPDLTQEQIDACIHRSLVSDRDLAPVARVWLLADDAGLANFPPVIMAEAVELVVSGKAVAILARRQEPEVDIRTALFHALDLVIAPQDAVGHG